MFLRICIRQPFGHFHFLKKGHIFCFSMYRGLQKPNSRTYNFVEVSGHNLEFPQTWGFFMDFNWTLATVKRLREFEEIEISRQSCRGDCELQGGKLLRLLSGFRPRIRPLYKIGWLLQRASRAESYLISLKYHFQCSAGGWEDHRKIIILEWRPNTPFCLRSLNL